MILIVAEHADDRLKPISRELAVLGRELADDLGRTLTVAILARDPASLVEECRALGPDRIVTVAGDRLEPYDPDVWTAAVEALVSEDEPAFVLAGHTSTGYDFLPRVAARTGRPLVPACIEWQRHGERVVFTRPVFNAKMHMRVTPKGEGPCFVTAAPGAFPPREPDEAGSGPPQDGGEPRLDAFDVDLSGLPVRSKRIGRESAAAGALDLGSADIIVAGGRGIREKEHFGLIDDLAEALGGAVGASRPVVDSGWRPRDYQIGSSGQTVSPRLYVAVGISGAVQHLVGMQSSRCIVAINKDADAPIFKVAHYGIVDDLFSVVPEITRTVRALKGQSPPVGSAGSGRESD